MELASALPGFEGADGAWREALLARAVLTGRTRGYRAHPQLVRFSACAKPADAIDVYRAGLYTEAVARGYAFDRAKLRSASLCKRLPVTSGQVEFELMHLRSKLQLRDRKLVRLLPRSGEPIDLHPLFRRVPGPVETWERP